MTGLATSTLYAKMQAGEFPRPIKLGRRAVGWKSNAIELWITQRSEVAGSVLSAVSEGTLTPIEGTRVMGLIDSYRRTLELTDIEFRIKALESNLANSA